jgi:hypothetical protein
METMTNMAINIRQMFQNQAVMVIGGIAIIVAIVVITMLTGGSSDATTSHKEPNWIMWVVIAILPLLALQIYGKGGAVVTTMIGVLALIAVVLLGNNISRSYTYGDKAEEVLQHQREVATRKALSDATTSAAAPAVAPAPVWNERDPVRITATKDKWSRTVIPPPKSCMEWYGMDYITRVRTTADADWHTIDEWNALKAKGIKILGVQHKALNEDTEVVHIFKDEDTCTP